MPDLHILILAAGHSRRMRGDDKLLQKVGAVPLLRRIAQAALALPAPVHVVLPPPAHPASAGREGALEGLPLSRITAPPETTAMGASLAAGVAGVPYDAKAVMVLLADMPEIDAADLRRMARAYANVASAPQPPILRGASDSGKAGQLAPGHPVIFPRRLFDQLTTLDQDAGAAAIIRAEPQPPVLVPLPGRHALVDLDTPEAWAQWRANRRDDETGKG